MLKPGVNAIHVHYCAPQVPDDGTLPVGRMVTFYLIKTEQYQALEAAWEPGVSWCADATGARANYGGRIAGAVSRGRTGDGIISPASYLHQA